MNLCLSFCFYGNSSFALDQTLSHFPCVCGAFGFGRMQTARDDDEGAYVWAWLGGLA